ncbi:hypothetical protein L484_011086 [Morus notabilis]|uniref:Uncharacterized protein n=1 Tax=Morus notabilis TaxID=981085 RepID=W9SRA8_9ROSA|nr:hypothetical protein L484_011086 [Morus notabilis]
MLHVELIKKDECGEGNEKEGLEVEENEECNKEHFGIIRDEYFDVNMEASELYDAGFAPRREGDRLDKPTLRSTLTERHRHLPQLQIKRFRI